MGLATVLVTQVVVTSVTLGYLKRSGAIKVQPLAIKDKRVRSALQCSLDLGEYLLDAAEGLVHRMQGHYVKGGRRDKAW
ncbi:hypothetical protein WJX72_002322 [[Myrmecia] bisecta]|uniref:Uncharacterized protein n=1 Tax=[Myrmecia] bisecta TaxID=41462 RepID=A0AAW1Q9N6_9CHLO